MLQKNFENNFEFNHYDFSRYSLEKKVRSAKSPFSFFFKFIVSFFFKFCNLINIDIFNIQRFMLSFWLITGTIGSVINYKMQLRLGIYYYHFFLLKRFKDFDFLYLLSFFREEFLYTQNADGFFFLNNSYFLYFNNLELFTNFKLARGVYFHRIQQKLFFQINFEKKRLYFFKLFLNTLKLYVN